jgi:hypothetical protein
MRCKRGDVVLRLGCVTVVALLFFFVVVALLWVADGVEDGVEG